MDAGHAVGHGGGEPVRGLHGVGEPWTIRSQAPPTGIGDPLSTMLQAMPETTTWTAMTTAPGSRHQRASTPVATTTAARRKSGRR